MPQPSSNGKMCAKTDNNTDMTHVSPIEIRQSTEKICGQIHLANQLVYINFHQSAVCQFKIANFNPYIQLRHYLRSRFVLSAYIPMCWQLKRLVEEPGMSHFSEVEKTRFKGSPACNLCFKCHNFTKFCIHYICRYGNTAINFNFTNVTQM